MLRFLFSPYGRTSRRVFWIFFVLYNVIATVAYLLLAVRYEGFLEEKLSTAEEILVFLGYELVALWILLAVLSKRLHDCGLPGWPFLAVTGTGFMVACLGHVLGGGNWRNTEWDVGELSGPAFWIGLAGLLPAACAGAIALLGAMFMPGQKGANKYGPDPLEGRP